LLTARCIIPNGAAGPGKLLISPNELALRPVPISGSKKRDGSSTRETTFADCDNVAVAADNVVGAASAVAAVP
jgi:hypothetical protein